MEHAHGSRVAQKNGQSAVAVDDLVTMVGVRLDAAHAELAATPDGVPYQRMLRTCLDDRSATVLSVGAKVRALAVIDDEFALSSVCVAVRSALILYGVRGVLTSPSHLKNMAAHDLMCEIHHMPVSEREGASWAGAALASLVAEVPAIAYLGDSETCAKALVAWVPAVKQDVSPDGLRNGLDIGKAIAQRPWFSKAHSHFGPEQLDLTPLSTYFVGDGLALGLGRGDTWLRSRAVTSMQEVAAGGPYLGLWENGVQDWMRTVQRAPTFLSACRGDLSLLDACLGLVSHPTWSDPALSLLAQLGDPASSVDRV